MNVKNTLYLILTLVLVISCTSNPFEVQLENKTDIQVKRFERDLFQVTPENIDSLLPVLSEKYPKFIPEDFKNQAYRRSLLAEVEFPLNQRLYADIGESGLTSEFIHQELNEVLSHYQYYYPDRNFDEAYTFISGLDQRMDPVMFDTNSVVIALDRYFGKDYKVYDQSGVYAYQKKVMDKMYLSVDIARYLALSDFQGLSPDATLLESMIYYGRINYFAQAMNPDKEKQVVLRFSKEELNYCESKAQNMWSYLIDKDLLYTKDPMQVKEFVEDRPFINVFGKESPGRVGVWFGREIVSNYMKKENLTLQELMEVQDLNEIFRKSKYRP